jgi:hypothetical protein
MSGEVRINYIEYEPTSQCHRGVEVIAYGVSRVAVATCTDRIGEIGTAFHGRLSRCHDADRADENKARGPYYLPPQMRSFMASSPKQRIVASAKRPIRQLLRDFISDVFDREITKV